MELIIYFVNLTKSISRKRQQRRRPGIGGITWKFNISGIKPIVISDEIHNKIQRRNSFKSLKISKYLYLVFWKIFEKALVYLIGCNKSISSTGRIRFGRIDMSIKHMKPVDRYR